MSEEEYAGTAALLEANGLSWEDLQSPGRPVQKLEMFLHDYSKMVGLGNFPNLTTLRLIDQRIERIEGLSGCQQLERLWLMENKISRIEGLSACTKLTELYLYSNRITTITGLDDLTQLQVLWLADNYISFISGLSNLVRLKQLNLARNDITSIGSTLLPNTALTSLNLADNKLSSFQEIAGLSRIRGLQDLCLSDPFWGDCPVASLSNYQTFVLCALPQLTSLDTLLLAEETRAAAIATFTKKRLYYNMRIRTLKRTAAALMQKAKVQCRCYCNMWAGMHSRLDLAAKSVQRQLQSASETEAASHQPQLEELHAAMQSIAAHQLLTESSVERDVNACKVSLDSAIARLDTELRTGGNVRLEEARPGDGCFSSCQHMLRSKLLCAKDTADGLGIVDIELVSVAKVHNRHLRQQFDQLTSSNCTDTGDVVQYMDYMFVGQHPAFPGELLQIAHKGFRTPSEMRGLNMDGAVRMATCVNLADQSRLLHSVEQVFAMQGGTAPEQDICELQECALQGQLLICKVNLSGSLQEAEGYVQLLSDQDIKKFLQNSISRPQRSCCLDGVPIGAKEYPGAAAVYRTAVMNTAAGADQKSARHDSSQQQGLPQHKVWYVFDSAQVLPEFLVTFRYKVSAGSVLSRACSCKESDMSATPAVAGIMGSSNLQDPLMIMCARPLVHWLSAAQQHNYLQPDLTSQDCGAMKLDVRAESLRKRCLSLLKAATVDRSQQHVQLSSNLATSLASIVNSTQLSSLTSLSLHDCGLSSCEGIFDQMPGLQTLVLSKNNLKSLDGLKPPRCLSQLDISYNQISYWHHSWLTRCSSLVLLNAAYNKLADIENLEQLVRSAPQIRTLNLTGNPAQGHKAYKPQLVCGLAQLHELDGRPVSRDGMSGSELDETVLKAGITEWHSEEGPVSCQLHSRAAKWESEIYSLTVEGKGLRSLTNIAAADKLVTANFADNVLVGLAGLHACKQLRELNLSNNLIVELSPVATLTSLCQLDVSFNNISDLASLSRLTGLTQLSIEGNKCASLQCLTALTCMMELYAAGNAVQEVKEVERLSVLPSLIILDLVGNPLTSGTEDYRHRLLYKLRHLKVLDGVPAEPAELAAARAKYSGRLTLSFLEEQLSSSCSLAAIRSLDISSLRIKDLGAVFSAGSPFSALTELVLDNNQISSIAPLRGLTGLLVLTVENNRLGDADSVALSSTVPAIAATGSGQGGDEELASSQALLPNLRNLHAAGNGLTSFKPLQLQSLTGLRSLFVQGNELQNLSGLATLTQLTELVADKNRIRLLDVDILSSLVSLRILSLEDNLIKGILLQTGPASIVNVVDPRSFPAKRVLPSLEVLQLAGNRLVDAADLEKLASLPALSKVTLTGNPLARKQAYRPLLLSHCPNLEAIDDRRVTEEERQYVESLCSMQQEAQAAGPAAAWLAAAAEARMCGWPPLTVAAGAVATNTSSACGASTITGTKPASNLPAVISCDVLAQLTTRATPNLLQIDTRGGVQLPLVVPSVPSIQSSVLVLSGAAAFGLEGLSINSGAGGMAPGQLASPSSHASSSFRQRPCSGKRTSGVGAVPASGASSSSPAGRRVMGHSTSGGSPGAFPVRQIAYRGY